jgi:hypothetical protein
MPDCPSCGSTNVRRGGSAIWVVYLVLIALALPAVLVFEMKAGLVGGIMILAVVAAHLILRQQVCLACGHQWRR